MQQNTIKTGIRQMQKKIQIVAYVSVVFNNHNFLRFQKQSHAETIFIELEINSHQTENL